MTKGLRLRQIVFACESETSFDTLQHILGFGAPFHDDLSTFGLVNAVFALGDQFVEIVVPKTDDAPARRFLNRNGEGGYMAIFQVPDMNAARARLDKLNMRRVWNADLDDISASHIHPADIGGAIVSIDEPRPAASWRWGGPDWTSNTVPGAASGITLTSPDPAALARRWADALGAEMEDGETHFETLDGPIEFILGEEDAISTYTLTLPDPAAAFARAQDKGLEMTNEGIFFAGTLLKITSP